MNYAFSGHVVFNPDNQRFGLSTEFHNANFKPVQKHKVSYLLSAFNLFKYADGTFN